MQCLTLFPSAGVSTKLPRGDPAKCWFKESDYRAVELHGEHLIGLDSLNVVYESFGKSSIDLIKVKALSCSFVKH
jgi:hypothetical protein